MEVLLNKTDRLASMADVFITGLRNACASDVKNQDYIPFLIVHALFDIQHNIFDHHKA